MLKKLITKVDFFYSTEIIRFKGEAEYKTLTGGVCSIFIIVILLYAFWSMILGTMERTTITFEEIVTRNEVPTPL